MNFPKPAIPERHPILQLLLLLLYSITGGVAATLIAALGIILCFDLNIMYALTAQQWTPETVLALKILQAATTIGVFVVPVLIFPRLEKVSRASVYALRKPQLITLLLVFVIMAVSLPLMEASIFLNRQLDLPESLGWLEKWIKAKEDEAMRTTLVLIEAKTLGTMFLNLIVIAVLPAIGEELMFRGAVQRTFGRLFRNEHVVIWVTAALFSAIHMQFYGFLPRMLLGAGFGYLYVWTGNLFYAMLAHFLNNAYTVIGAFLIQKQGGSLEEFDKTPVFAWYRYVISLILTIALFRLLKQRTEQSERQLDQSIHDHQSLRSGDPETGPH